MKRMHIHVGVEDIAQAVRFYSGLFGQEPAKVKADYAKWMLDDPRVNFSVSTRARQGVDHLGLQVDDEKELDALREGFRKADMTTFDEGQTACCYARSDKSWLRDPAGIAWEAFLTMADAQVYSEASAREGGACCVPEINDRTASSGPGVQAAGCCG